jgi:hypothetical protein
MRGGPRCARCRIPIEQSQTSNLQFRPSLWSWESAENEAAACDQCTDTFGAEAENWKCEEFGESLTTIRN